MEMDELAELESLSPEQRQLVLRAQARERQRWEERWERDDEAGRNALMQLIVFAVLFAAVVGWVAYTFGRNAGEDDAWATAERRATLVALRGFCAAGDEALAEVQSSAGVLGEIPKAILLGDIAEALVAEAELRFPGRYGEATRAFRNPLDQQGLICGELGPYGFSVLAGIEPEDMRPGD